MLNPPAKAHVIHFLIQLPGVILPFNVEGTYRTSFIIGTAYQLQGAGVIAPLAYLLIISLTSSVREGGTKHDTAPLTHRQAEFVLVWILLKSVLPSVLVVFTFSPCWIAFWQRVPW